MSVSVNKLYCRHDLNHYIKFLLVIMHVDILYLFFGFDHTASVGSLHWQH